MMLLGMTVKVASHPSARLAHQEIFQSSLQTMMIESLWSETRLLQRKGRSLCASSLCVSDCRLWGRCCHGCIDIRLLQQLLSCDCECCSVVCVQSRHGGDNWLWPRRMGENKAMHPQMRVPKRATFKGRQFWSADETEKKGNKKETGGTSR